MQSKPFPGVPDVYGNQRVGGTCSQSEQIQLLTQNLLMTHAICSVPTVGLPLGFTLSFNSTLADVVGPLGSGWVHNYMMGLEIGETTVTFTADSGRPYGFVLVAGSWIAADGYSFLPATLTNPAEDPIAWRLTFPNGSFYGFDSDGLLVALVDRHNYYTVMTYSESLLASVTEPTGRQLRFTYQNQRLSSVTDPNGNTTTFVYNDNLDLTAIVGPEGCVTSFAWQYPGGDEYPYVESRTDALGNTITFAYAGEGVVESVTDAEGNVVSYSVGTFTESTGDLGTNVNLTQVQVTDPVGNVWTYRFDLSGNLWRAIDALGHHRHYRWAPVGAIMQESLPFPPTDGPRDNFNNAYRRYGFDSNGNQICAVDATGIMTNFQYDSFGNVISRFPGQVNLAVQGDWQGSYGAQGYLLCAFEPPEGDTPVADLASLPSYISSIAETGTGYTEVSDVAAQPYSSEDPRVPLGPVVPVRYAGRWSSGSGTQLQFQINLSELATFNLSLYSNCVDQGYYDFGVEPVYGIYYLRLSSA